MKLIILPQLEEEERSTQSLFRLYVGPTENTLVMSYEKCIGKETAAPGSECI